MGLFDFLGDIFSGAKDTLGTVGGSLSDVLRSGGDALGAGGSAATTVADAAPAAAETAGDAGGRFLPWLADAGGSLVDAVKGVGSGLGGVAKAALPVAQLGAAGLGAYSGVKASEAAAENAKIQKRAIENQERAAVPLTNYGESQIKAAQAGNVPTAIQAQIDLWARGAKQKARDYLARAGIPDSKAAADWEAWIDQQAEGMKASALGAEADRGVNALRSGAQVSGNVGQQAGQQVSTIDGLIANANQVLARLAAGAA